MTTPPVPYTVLGGYLGAGKTTLLNQLLRANAGMRLAVIVNDFGDIGIDAELIADRNGDTISLTNGCVCCSASDGLAVALDGLRARADELDHVIVEASGVSDPVRIGDYAQPFGFELRGVIVLADAEQVRNRAGDRYVGGDVLRQLRGADLVVLTKPDLVAPARLDEVRGWLADVAPGTPVLSSARGRIPAELVLGDVAAAPPRSATSRAGDVDHVVDYDRWSHRRVGAIDRATFDAFIEALPDGVLRAKGLIHLAEDPAHRHVLQLVGHRVSLTRDVAWPSGEVPRTEVVVIALPGTLDHVALDARMSD